MTPQEYQQYVIQSAVHQMQYQQWVETNESRALDAAEKILPEMKTNAAVRTMVESIRLAGLQTGKDTNSYEAAKMVKEALGLSTKQVADKVAKAKADGIQSAKTSIKVQKNAAVETKGSTKKKSDSTKDVHLTKRLKAGDDEAFAELFAQWDKDGKLS
jgi:protein-disulfide isomerase-like protein with CxxC motif